MKQKGYIALVTVLIIGSIGSAIAISLILLGVGFSRTSFAIEQSNQAKALANTCAENALQQIRSNSSFSGTNTLTLNGGSCSYTVTVLSGENRTVIASGTYGTVIRKISISVTAINPKIIASWIEAP